jgi:hypothetical protein
MAISNPIIFINDYLREKLSDLLPPANIDVDVPFFPTSPSTIEQLTQTAVINNEGQLFAVYDRMFRLRRSPFPHIKDEQAIYYFYALDIPYMLDALQHISDLLDRGDESAQELNTWIKSKLEDDVYIKNKGTTNEKSFLPVYFHETNIYHLQETRDIIDFGTARTYAGNKIIVNYCYHSVGEKRSGSKTTYNDTQIN